MLRFLAKSVVKPGSVAASQIMAVQVAAVSTLGTTVPVAKIFSAASQKKVQVVLKQGLDLSVMLDPDPVPA